MEITKFEDIDFTQDQYWRAKIGKAEAKEIIKRMLRNQRKLKRKKES